MATIDIDTPNGPISAALELPDGDGPHGGVVILHDAFGLSNDVRAITRRFADAGYAAIAPNLYSRGGVVRCIRGVIRDLLARSGPAIDDILAARDALSARPGIAGADGIGVVGFCLGGGFALAVSPKGFGASAPFYGTMPWKNLDDVIGGACPIVASLGKNDITLRGAEDKLVGVLERHEVPHDVVSYDGAGHAFANHVEPAVLGAVTKVLGFGYKHEQSEDAYRRVFEFFDRHLDLPNGESV